LNNTELKVLQSRQGIILPNSLKRTAFHLQVVKCKKKIQKKEKDEYFEEKK